MQLATNIVIIIAIFPVMGFLIVYKLHQQLGELISARIEKSCDKKYREFNSIKYKPTKFELILHITIFTIGAIIVMCIIISVNLLVIILLSIIEFILLIKLIIELSNNFYKELERNIELSANKTNRQPSC